AAARLPERAERLAPLILGKLGEALEVVAQRGQRPNRLPAEKCPPPRERIRIRIAARALARQLGKHGGANRRPQVAEAGTKTLRVCLAGQHLLAASRRRLRA